jgi:hypothetical protein
MRKVFISLAAIALLSLTASVASASCQYNAPGKAKGLKSSMVRAYASCPGITHAATNTLTNAGVPACTPPFALSNFLFGPKGQCLIKMKTKLEVPCSDGSGEDCHNTRLMTKCGDVRESDGVTLISESGSAIGWNLNTVTRATMLDEDSVDPDTGVVTPGAGPLTVIDFPAQFAFPPGKKGKLKLKSSTNELLNALFGPGSALGTCTQLETVSIAVADNAGNIFASLGASTQ